MITNMVTDENLSMKTDENLLNIDTLKLGKSQKVFAFCEKATTRPRSDNGEAFIRFIFRDVKGRRIIGRRFDLLSVDKLGTMVNDMRNRIIVCTVKLLYFKGKYLKVEDFEVVNEGISNIIFTKFLATNIENLDGERNSFKYLIESFQSEFSITGLDKLLEEFDVYTKFDNSYSPDVLNGRLGYKYLNCNMFTEIYANFKKVRLARYDILANIFVEAILTDDVELGEVMHQLIVLEGIVSRMGSCDLITVYKKVKSTIYLMYNLSSHSLDASSIVIVTIRNSILDIHKANNVILDNIGVFEYKDKMFIGE